MIKRIKAKLKWIFRTPIKIEYPNDECDIMHKVIDFYERVNKYGVKKER